jgi:hypothetical protein
MLIRRAAERKVLIIEVKFDPKLGNSDSICGETCITWAFHPFNGKSYIMDIFTIKI